MVGIKPVCILDPIEAAIAAGPPTQELPYRRTTP